MHKTFWLTGKDGFDKELPEPFISEKNHGVDDQLVEQIKKIIADKAAQKQVEDKIAEQMLSKVPLLVQPIENENDTESKSNKLQENTKISSKTNLRAVLNKHLSQDKENGDIPKNRALSAKLTKFNKNDSGFSETTNQLSTPNNNNKKTSIEIIQEKSHQQHPNNSNKISPFPDIDSVV
ncbi:unnamed protein product [Brachionus calyciflorus]|uniref:Uncharacterized protein n=1 Tax=Brachionus calyciflorus TaxID=104777 RepID=A0A814CLQ1_9BILA|nr:unnamed protein product [Brachionus calyciflorus]